MKIVFALLPTVLRHTRFISNTQCIPTARRRLRARGNYVILFDLFLVIQTINTIINMNFPPPGIRLDYMAEEYDIYGDENFGDLQNEDIFDDVVTDSPARATKRAKTDSANGNTQGDDDLFDDFGEYDKVCDVWVSCRVYTMHIDTLVTQEFKDVNNQNATQQQTSAATGEQSSQRPNMQQQPQHSRPPPPQQQTQKDTSENTAPASKREQSTSMSQLRGRESNPTNALYVGELDWWVTDEDLKEPIMNVGIGAELREITFYEHKVNGKSRGIAFLQFTTEEASTRAKAALEQNEFSGKLPVVTFTSAQNPFKHTPKEPVPKAQRMQGHQMMGRPPMNANAQMMPNTGFNPMMAAGFMNPYGGFPNPMMAAGFMGNAGGGRGNMRGGQGNYMNRGGGRGGGGMMGYSDGSGFNGKGFDGGLSQGVCVSAGFPGMHVNPAFFDSQGGGYGGGG
ncbi:hypothetical protein INT43_000253 [Umbelopsis isabellina]|uniref:RRM domain-containing protein n=1 Tax=Mortierella isabellina TaxID=91625 RepID=A0A8H7PFH0_MORIS|nr:hypothetical protein INT43_000253 [Umbelopsis isabellina]